ncbi:MAG: LCP family protein [Clostridia bacterium]|nr:LCP family protein [Clostridia bacterium]
MVDKHVRPESDAENGVRPLTTDIEAFRPEDFEEELKQRKKHKRLIFLIVLLIVLILLAGAGTAGYAYYTKLKTQTSSLFNPTPVPTAAPTRAPEPAPGKAGTATVTPEPTPTPDPFAAYVQTPPVLEQNILNILLIGVDYSAERETWKGKDGVSAAHADVMIVLAVNFDNNTASLISLPRDTYTTIPGVSGIYKLNAALNCGGGIYAANDAGFKKCCEAASFWLGGIPVDYYYAVTMPAVKGLVDAIGGVDYRLEIDFTLNGRHYSKGKKHMNGQAVLDYLRVRKSGSGLEPGQTGDPNRVNRQKKMLVAIFDQLKKKGNILKIADILAAFDGQLFTNCSFEQTASLALYGSSMPSSNISMHSMEGDMHSMYRWNFNFVKQSKRVQLIKKIYGVTVPEYPALSYAGAQITQQTRIANQYINTCGPLTELMLEKRAASDAATRDEDRFTDTQMNHFTSYMDKLEKLKDLRSTSSTGKLKNACAAFKNAALKCRSVFGYTGELVWTVPTLADMNEIYVDFR